MLYNLADLPQSAVLLDTLKYDMLKVIFLQAVIYKTNIQILTVFPFEGIFTCIWV